MKIRQLSEALQKKAEEELNEIPSELEDNLENLRNWLSQQEHIKYKDDDQLLVNFLRGSKFSLQRAKEKIDAYYTLRTVAPEFSLSLDPFQQDVQALFKTRMFTLLPIPKNEPASARVILMRFADYNPDEVTMNTTLKVSSMVINILFNEDDNLVVGGAKVIWDMKGVHYKTALQCTPDLIKKCAYCYEKAYPTRLKSIYVINAPAIFESLFNVIKLLFSAKIAKRLHVYSNNNLEEIYKDIPKDILPDEYGGRAGPFSGLADELRKTVESHRDMLLEEKNYYTEESKRPDRQQTDEGLFGWDGSFKNLKID